MPDGCLEDTKNCAALNHITAVRLKVEENQLVDVFAGIGVPVNGLKGA